MINDPKIPKTAEDCLEHLGTLSSEQFDFTVAQIELYALSQRGEAIDECDRLFQKAIDRAFSKPITAAEFTAAAAKGESRSDQY